MSIVNFNFFLKTLFNKLRAKYPEYAIFLKMTDLLAALAGKNNKIEEAAMPLLFVCYYTDLSINILRIFFFRRVFSSQQTINDMIYPDRYGDIDYKDNGTRLDMITSLYPSHN